MTTKLRQAEWRENTLILVQRKLFLFLQGIPKSQGTLNKLQWKRVRLISGLIDNGRANLSLALKELQSLNKNI